MLALQNEFKDKVKIVLVTSDYLDAVNKLWEMLHNNRIEKPVRAGHQLSLVIADTMLKKYFPNEQHPVHAWIDPKGIFLGMATEETTTTENIEKVLAGKKVQLAKYYVPNIKENQLNSWFDTRIGFGDHLMSFSCLTKYDERVNAVAHIISKSDSITKKKSEITCINCSILSLYEEAYFRNPQIRKPVILNLKAADNYYYPQDQSFWRLSNEYCYALKLSRFQSQDIFFEMQTDLDRLFHLKSGLETRKVKCLILKRISSSEKFHTHGGVSNFKTFNDSDGTRVLDLTNYSMQNLDALIIGYSGIPSTKYLLPPMPFFDETNYKGNVDIKLPDVSDGSYSIPNLRRYLQKYGLDVVEEYRNVNNVLVIRDNPKPAN